MWRIGNLNADKCTAQRAKRTILRDGSNAQVGPGYHILTKHNKCTAYASS